MHWNSQPHIKQAKEGGEESKQEEGEAEVGAATESEPEHVPTYETEMRHASVSAFKKAMGLHIDNYKLNYATKNFSL